MDESKCVGCGICVNTCPEGIEVEGGKATIKDVNADCLEDAAEACPRSAILLEGAKEESERESTKTDRKTDTGPRGSGRGRGMGAGRGKGLGKGPRDGRGKGRGGRREK